MSTRTDTEKKSAYKKSWAKYIWIYLAVGGIAYLLIYLFAFHHVGGAAGGGGY